MLVTEVGGDMHCPDISTTVSFKLSVVHIDLQAPVLQRLSSHLKVEVYTNIVYWCTYIYNTKIGIVYNI